MGTIDEKLKELGIELPEPPKPAANYVPYVISGNQVFISGQVPMRNGELQYRGKVGQDFSLEEAQECARLVAKNILSVLKAACHGDLDRVRRCIKLGGFVNCTPDFDQQPQVINGASEMMVAVLGETGRHARFAVGSNVLPFNVAVEIDAIFEIDTKDLPS